VHGVVIRRVVRLDAAYDPDIGCRGVDTRDVIGVWRPDGF
jgi:hypothetical protein